MNDPWAGPVAEPPKITAHQIHRVIGLIANYTEPEATDLIRTLTVRNSGAPCACGMPFGGHSGSCPTQGRLD